MKSPLDVFFKFGDKVTKGDPRRKADFDYYMIWIIFIAFFTILVDRVVDFVTTLSFTALGWALVMVCILWFQYGSLKVQWESRKLTKKINLKKIDKIESFDEMLK